MEFDLNSSINAACAASPWDLGNRVLYDLCKKNPLHTEVPAVIAKVWLIGRSYAAAIERRRDKESQNDDFYVHSVAPRIIRSDIDTWIGSAEKYSGASDESFSTILSVHAAVTGLFSEISGLEKRSLASKYLHFHLPNLFYIYDTRAVEAMRLLSPLVGRARGCSEGYDNEYRKFAEKCLRLQTHINSTFKVSLTPRQIDNLLLHIHANETYKSQ
jgi:hypothetical protein